MNWGKQSGTSDGSVLQPKADWCCGTALLPLLFQMKLNVLCTFFSSAGTLSERWGTTDLPLVLLQITFHFFFQDSDKKFWKTATLPSHCHWLSAKSASRWGSSRAMIIIGRMVVRALLLRSTACSGRNKFRAVYEERHLETINELQIIVNISMEAIGI